MDTQPSFRVTPRWSRTDQGDPAHVTSESEALTAARSMLRSTKRPVFVEIAARVSHHDLETLAPWQPLGTMVLIGETFVCDAVDRGDQLEQMLVSQVSQAEEALASYRSVRDRFWTVASEELAEASGW